MGVRGDRGNDEGAAKESLRLSTLCKVDDEREKRECPKSSEASASSAPPVANGSAEIVEQKPHRTVKSSALHIKVVDH